MEAGNRFVRADGVLSAPVDAEIVLLPASLQHYVALNAVGRRIWELLAEPRSLPDLCARLEQEFDAAPGVIESEVRPFVEALLREGLLHEVAE